MKSKKNIQVPDQVYERFVRLLIKKVLIEEKQEKRVPVKNEQVAR